MNESYSADTADSNTNPGSTSSDDKIARGAAAAHTAVDAVAARVRSASETVQSARETLKPKVSQLTDDCHQYLVSQPLKALGAAIAFGFLIGRLVR